MRENEVNNKLTNIDREEYKRNGFIIVENILKKNELLDFKKGLEKLIISYLEKASIERKKDFLLDLDQKNILNQGTSLLEKIDHIYIRQLYACIQFMPEFIRLAYSKKITSIIRNLLNLEEDSPLYSGSQICRIDIPEVKGYTFDWHQEVFYQIPKSNFVQTWAPLVNPIVKGFGALEVRIGSNNEGIAKQIWHQKEGIPDQIIVSPEIVSKYKKKIVELDLGSVLLFSGKLFHKSGESNSVNTRYTLVGSFHSINNKYFYPRGMENLTITPQEYYEQERKKWD